MTPQPLPRENCRTRLLFARHGATEPNLAGLRCGGDLDPPLTEVGRQQAFELARRVAARTDRVDLVICSDLLRTRETARIVCEWLQGPELRVIPGFRERRLGQWNLQPIVDTEPQLAAGVTPPGGESSADFADRIEFELRRIATELQQRQVLLVASKGVGRVLHVLAGSPLRQPMANAELHELRFVDLDTIEPVESAS
jgi:2,3-bisphosphoglycerate-dependent phosphoglycerate mutase